MPHEPNHRTPRQDSFLSGVESALLGRAAAKAKKKKKVHADPNWGGGKSMPRGTGIDSGGDPTSVSSDHDRSPEYIDPETGYRDPINPETGLRSAPLEVSPRSTSAKERRSPMVRGLRMGAGKNLVDPTGVLNRGAKALIGAATALPRALGQAKREQDEFLAQAAKPVLSPAQLKAQWSPEEKARQEDMRRRFRESRRPIDPFTGEPVEEVKEIARRTRLLDGQEPRTPEEPPSPEQIQGVGEGMSNFFGRIMGQGDRIEMENNKKTTPLPKGEGFTDPTLLPDKKATLRRERRKQKRQQRRRRK